MLIFLDENFTKNSFKEVDILEEQGFSSNPEIAGMQILYEMSTSYDAIERDFLVESYEAIIKDGEYLNEGFIEGVKKFFAKIIEWLKGAWNWITGLIKKFFNWLLGRSDERSKKVQATRTRRVINDTAYAIKNNNTMSKEEKNKTLSELAKAYRKGDISDIKVKPEVLSTLKNSNEKIGDVEKKVKVNIDFRLDSYKALIDYEIGNYLNDFSKDNLVKEALLQATDSNVIKSSNFLSAEKYEELNKHLSQTNIFEEKELKQSLKKKFILLGSKREVTYQEIFNFIMSADSRDNLKKAGETEINKNKELFNSIEKQLQEKSRELEKDQEVNSSKLASIKAYTSLFKNSINKVIAFAMGKYKVIDVLLEMALIAYNAKNDSLFDKNGNIEI